MQLALMLDRVVTPKRLVYLLKHSRVHHLGEGEAEAGREELDWQADFMQGHSRF